MEEVSEVISEEVTSEENPEDPSDTEKKNCRCNLKTKVYDKKIEGESM